MKKNYTDLNRRNISGFSSKQTNLVEDNPDFYYKNRTSWFAGLMLVFALFFANTTVFAQTNISAYTLATTTGATYTPITGGAVFTSLTPPTGKLYDDDVSSAITIPAFPFGGTTVTTVYISTNGYITFGVAPGANTYTALSTTLASSTGAVAAYAQDGGAAVGSGAEIRYQDLGTEFVVQYTNHSNLNNITTDKLNFQIHLNYATGVISIVYGTCTAPGASTFGTPVQVGIRGNSTTYATNVNNLAIANVPLNTTEDWSNAITPYSNTGAMVYSSGVNANIKIPAGLTFTWTPGTQLPVRTFTAPTAITTTSANLAWTAPTGATSYNVQYRIPGTAAWTNWSGNPVATTSVAFTGLNAGTSYQVRVQAVGTGSSIYSHIPSPAAADGYSTAGTFTTLYNCTSSPTALTSSLITGSSATISWTAPASAPANGYEYYYSTSSTVPIISTIASGSTGAGIVTVGLTGLSQTTKYYYWVRTNCDGTNKGPWVAGTAFTTPYNCTSLPTTLTSSAITTTTAAINWVAPASAPASGYEYYYSTSSTTPIYATTASGSTGAGVLTANLVGLTDSTPYYYWVRTNCNGTDKGAWVAGASFTTNCLPVATLSQNFDSYATGSIVPTCWGRIVSGTSVSQTITTTTPASGVNNMYQYNPTTGGVNVVVFPELSTINSGYQLRFKVRTTVVATTLDIGYLTTPTDATTFVLVQTLTLPNTTYGAESKIPFPTSVPATARVAVRMPVQATGSPAVYWDDVIWEMIPTCIEPTAVTVSAITSTTATINWVAPASAPANGYDVYYSTTNTAPTATTTPTVTGITGGVTTNLTALNTSTAYYVWVRSACSASDKSVWTYVVSFNTLCNATNVPYTLDFESITTPALPGCTSNVNAGTGNNWVTYSPNGYGFVNKTLTYIYNSTYAANTWFFTQGINLTAGTQYTIAYKYGNNGGTSFPEKLKVAYGTSQTVAAMTNAIADYTSITNGTSSSTSVALIASINFTPTTTGVYYFGFNAYSAANMNRLFVDDISVTTAVLGTTEVSTKEKSVTIYPNPFKDILNISDVKDVTSVIISDISGRTVKTIAKPTSELNLSDLNTGLYLVTLKYKDGSVKTMKAIKK